jgi:hypothetical protein
MSKTINRFAANTAIEAAHAVPLRSHEEAKFPIIARDDVALIRGINVNGNCIARTICATTSILHIKYERFGAQSTIEWPLNATK